MLKLSENEGWVVDEVVWTIAENFDKLPDYLKNLLFKLSERDEIAWHVPLPVARNFDKLPEDVRNLLFGLFEKDKATWYIGGL